MCPDGVLADLHDDVVAGLERLLDLALRATETRCVPVDLARIQHAVAAAADVDECGLHRGQHVLHDAQVDVADQRRRRRAGDEVLDQHAVLEHRDLRVSAALVRRLGADLVPDDHHPVDGLAAGQEFGLAQDRRAPPSRVAPVAASLPLGFQPRRSGDALNLVVVALGVRARSPFVDNGIRRIVRRAVGVVPRAAALAPTPATPTPGVAVPGAGVFVSIVIVIVIVVGVAVLVVLGAVSVAVLAATLLAASATAAAPAPSAPPVRGAPRLVAVRGVAVERLVVGVVVLVVFFVGGLGPLHRLWRDEQRHVVGRAGAAPQP